MKKTTFVGTALALCFAVQSCSDSVVKDVSHYDDEEFEKLSARLDLPRETFDYPILTNVNTSGVAEDDRPFHKATLGRVLFYDNMLSVDETVSCASCHKQEAAFADSEAFSEGLSNNSTARNSLPLGNTIGFVKYYGTDLSVQSGFFSWDETFQSINDQSKAAIESDKEMGHNFTALVSKLRSQDHYQVLFDKAYSTEGGINETNILDAITEFVNSMSSRKSHFDKSIPAPTNRFSPVDVESDFAAFSASENRGKQIFNNNCSTCHGATHNSIIQSSANNGLELNYTDKGRGAVDNESYLNGVFKVPSLRNIELSAPYMHDGRFETLEEVIEHYSSGIQDHDNLHFALKSPTGGAKPFQYSAQDKEDLVEYLKSLTDQDFIASAKFADPFK